jgi:hypothetical protein
VANVDVRVHVGKCRDAIVPRLHIGDSNIACNVQLAYDTRICSGVDSGVTISILLLDLCSYYVPVDSAFLSKEEVKSKVIRRGPS